LGQPPAGPPLVVGDLLLVPTREPGQPAPHSTLHALNLDKGSTRWQRPFEYALVSGLAVVQTSKVSETLEVSKVLALVATTSTDLLRGEGALVALDAAGGERYRWSPGVQRVSAPVVARSDDFNRPDTGATKVATTDSIRDLGGVACVTADARTLVLLDLATGAERARVALEASASLSAPALVGDVAYVPCRGPHILAVGLDGHPRWRFDAEGPPDAWLDKTPVVAGERIFAVLSTGVVLALRVGDGSLAWRVDVGPTGKSLSPPATDGERLFVGARDGLHALALADGNELWSLPTPRRITAAPVVTGGVVYVDCHDHHLYALDSATGQELWRHEARRRIEVSPVLATCGEPRRPCIFVADRGGTLAAVARPLSAQEHEVAGHWTEAARLYEQAELWPRAVECRKKAGNWEQVGHIQQRLGDFAAAANAFIQATRDLEQKAPPDEARLADLWAAAENCYRKAFDQDRAEQCRRQVARHRHLPYIEMKIKPPEMMIENKYALLEFTLHNAGGGEARQLVVHHTPSEFVGELSQTREIRGLYPGQKLSQTLSVCPLASGPVPLVIAADYADAAGNPYEVTYRTHVNVLEPGRPPARPPAPYPESPPMTTDFADFDLLLDQCSGDVYPVHVVRSSAGEARGDFCMPFTSHELARALWRLEEDEADEDFLRGLGSRLFEALFRADVGNRFRSSQGMTAQGKGLRLRLRVEAGELIPLPWELLYDPERREFLSLTRRAPIVRHLTVPRPIVARPVSPPLRMLVVPASPKDMVPLDVEKEAEALKQAVQPLVDKAELDIKTLRPPTAQALREHLVDYPCHILHFIGHGGFDGREGYIVLEDSKGRAHCLGAQQLKVLFYNTPVRLAVLNACLTAQDTVRKSSGVPRQTYLGVAPALVDAGLLAVVAMQFSVSDVGAQVFARDFYCMLARRKLVEEAVDQARGAVMLELGLGRRDWVAPVLFLRGSSGELFPDR